MVLAGIIDKRSKDRYISERYLDVGCVLRAKAGPGRTGKLSCVGQLRSPANCEQALGKWQVTAASGFPVISLVGLQVNSHEKALCGLEHDERWVREMLSPSWLEILCATTTPTLRQRFSAITHRCRTGEGE